MKITEEKAIELLKEIIGDPTILQPAFRYKEPLKMAIEALEKQIPQKPAIFTFEYEKEEKELQICPRCETTAILGLNYCYKCGQALNFRLE